MTKVNKKCKDTVFTKMFGDEDKEYLMQLYQALHPEDQSTGKDDLKIVTLENFFTVSIYNDLGFIVKQKLIVLVEAQSTWSVNILIRMFMYLGRTYYDYIYSDEALTKQLYTNKKVPIPKPELHVVYTGNKKDMPQIMSFKDEFFAGEDVGIDLKVNVIIADDSKKDIIWQYIMFCKVYDIQIREHGPTPKAVSETIRICKEKGYLADYLSKHEKEVRKVLLMNREEIEQGYRDLLVEETRKKTLAESAAERKKLKIQRDKYAAERDKYAAERDNIANENATLKARIAELESRLQGKQD